MTFFEMNDLYCILIVVHINTITLSSRHTFWCKCKVSTAQSAAQHFYSLLLQYISVQKTESPDRMDPLYAPTEPERHYDYGFSV